MASLLWRAHKGHNAAFWVEVEIYIYLGTARVRVRRHGVPHSAFLHFCEAHDELATLDAVHVNVFVERTAVRIGQRAEFEWRGMFHGAQRGGVCRMRRVAQKIKSRGIRLIFAAERNILAASADVEAIE